MPESAFELDEIDRQIVAGLQVWPRAPWRQVGEVLNIDATTAARRWARIHEAGYAWFSTYLLRRYTDPVTGLSRERLLRALVEMQIQPSKKDAALRRLQHHESLLILRSTIGEWNVSLDWQGRSIRDLEAFLKDEVSNIDGLIAVRSFPLVQRPLHGGSWRYESLSLAQEDALREMQRKHLFDPSPIPGSWHASDAAIIDLLHEDARMSYSEIAQRTGFSVATAKRHLSHLLSNGDLVIRCDLARNLSMRPVTVRFLANAPVSDMAETVRKLSEFPGVRSCSVLLGKYNLMINAWLHGIHESMDFESKLLVVAPTLEILERDLVTTLHRHGGRDLGDLGLAAVDH